MKQKIFNLLITCVLVVGMASCRSTTYLITAGSENLRSLAKITEGENACIQPGGSVESNILFYVSAVGGKLNVYRKDNPTAPAQIQLTSDANCEFPTYCAKTDRVAFSRAINAYYDIYMKPISGNALIPVTETNNVDEYVPSISPDGKFLAYQKGYINSVNAEIWLKDLTSGENMLLCKGATPSISPDGKKIAYVKVESNNSRNIWVMDLDGSNAQQLTVSKEEYAGYPKWSPSGNKIVFQSNKKKGNFDIFVMNADGTGLMQLTTNESEDLTPFWSKDGYIYISSDRGAHKGKYNIWRFYYEE